MNCETAFEITDRVAAYFGKRENLIVPNVSWGLLMYNAFDAASVGSWQRTLLYRNKPLPWEPLEPVFYDRLFCSS